MIFFVPCCNRAKEIIACCLFKKVSVEASSTVVAERIFYSWVYRKRS